MELDPGRYRDVQAVAVLEENAQEAVVVAVLLYVL